MQLVAVDILGPLPESTAGKSYLLVAGDYFTRWMEAYVPYSESGSQYGGKKADRRDVFTFLSARPTPFGSK